MDATSDPRCSALTEEVADKKVKKYLAGPNPPDPELDIRSIMRLVTGRDDYTFDQILLK